MKISRKSLVFLVCSCLVLGVAVRQSLIYLSGSAKRFRTDKVAAVPSLVLPEQCTNPEVRVSKPGIPAPRPVRIDEVSKALHRYLKIAEIGSRYLHRGAILTAGDVLFPGIDTGNLKHLPMVLSPLEYGVLRKFFDAPDDPGVKEALRLSAHVFRILYEDRSVVKYFKKELIPVLEPGDKEIGEFLTKYRHDLERLTPLHRQGTEQIKETVKQFLLNRNIDSYFNDLLDEFGARKRLQLKWQSVPKPWGLPGDMHTPAKPVSDTDRMYAGGRELHPDTVLFSVDDQPVTAGVIVGGKDLLVLSIVKDSQVNAVLDGLFPRFDEEGANPYRWVRSFSPGVQGTVCSALFKSLITARMKNRAIAYDELERYSLEHLKLVAIITVASYCAGQATLPGQGAVADPQCLAYMGRTIEQWTGFSLVNPWMVSEPLAYGITRFKTKVRAPTPEMAVNQIQVPQGAGELQVLISQEVNRYRYVGTQMHLSDPGGRPYDLRQHNPETYLLKKRLGRNYPMSASQGLMGNTAVPSGQSHTRVGHEFPDSQTEYSDTDTVLRTMYRENREVFRIGPSYQFQIIFHHDRNVVESALVQVTKGMPFEKTAFMFSSFYYDDLGQRFFPAQVLKPEISSVLEAVLPGAISDVFAVHSPGEGYAVVLVKSKQPAKVLPFERPNVRDVLQHHRHGFVLEQVLGREVGETRFVASLSRWIVPFESQEVRAMLAAVDSIF